MVTEETVRKQLDTLFEEGAVLARVFGEQQEALQIVREAKGKAKEKEQEKEQEKEEQQGDEGKTIDFEVLYQRWYSRALPLMKQLAPERYAEFQAYYRPDSKRDGFDGYSYVIQDYFCRRPINADYGALPWVPTLRCFVSQLAILRSVADRIPWMALDTEDQTARGLQLAELEAARDLIKISERAAGALAGVVLEAHLRKLAARHKLKLRKQSPSLGELAAALKEARVLDVPAFSQVTWLAELRDRCRKAEGEAPTKLQVRDLIDGTHWLITNLF